jgi:hypothetical protein
MHPAYLSLAAALRERLAIIGDLNLRATNPAAHLEQLQKASERIDSLQTQLPADCDPHLRHYLKNCSYQKALAHLEANA